MSTSSFRCSGGIGWKSLTWARFASVVRFLKKMVISLLFWRLVGEEKCLAGLDFINRVKVDALLKYTEFQSLAPSTRSGQSVLFLGWKHSRWLRKCLNISVSAGPGFSSAKVKSRAIGQVLSTSLSNHPSHRAALLPLPPLTSPSLSIDPQRQVEKNENVI